MTIFPYISFLGVSVSNISEKRTYVFSVFNSPVVCRPLILVYQRVNINRYLHVQGLNCSNARGDGTITSLETSPVTA